MTAVPNTDQLLLENAFVERQGLGRESARRVVRRLASSGEDIWDSALAWARTGEMPAGPDVDGYTPARLGHRLLPSQAFTALAALRSDPISAERALRHSPPALSRHRALDFERQVEAILSRLGDAVTVSREPQLGAARWRPDFAVRGPDGILLVEAKANVNPALLRRTADLLRAAQEASGAAAAVIVLPRRRETGLDLDVPAISIFELGEYARRVIGAHPE